MAGKIRVLIVDDSIFFREFMSRSLASDPAIDVVGVASDAFEANRKIEELSPDVLTLDIEMPRMRGTDFLRTVCPRYPRLKVVVISSVSGVVFEALQNGAVDFVSKPNSQLKVDNSAFIAETLSKIKIAAAARFTRMAPAPPPVSKLPAPGLSKQIGGPASPASFKNRDAILAIGASTGGTEAILAVLKDLPANIPGIVIVQHMPPVFTKMYADRLNKICKISVREAADGDRVTAGLALIAPGGDRQMRILRDPGGYSVRLTAGEKVSGHCPSVDVLFESVAESAGKNAVGVLLTGMGADGAKHLLTMKKKGAHTIGQDQESCIVYGMPMVAYNLGAVTEQLPLTSIAGAVIKKLS
ncbi:MAG: chemotaxis response regulator protein-glutamate methylesterase [Oscillospiraceae bacterium]|jgi:two-component system chemotaxis response regulator CheB|nr:chemotaxis response regulator protein-glutamate methylesterase [Oscillospiraceae bacterium]